MASIGTKARLHVARDSRIGWFLDAGSLGELLLPRNEIHDRQPADGSVEVFIYCDSEDRPIATLREPKVMPGNFGCLRVIDVNATGAYLDWGLPKDLLLPFREQARPVKVGDELVVYVLKDPHTERLFASARLQRHLDHSPHRHQAGDRVQIMIVQRTPLGFNVIVNSAHTGLLHHSEVHQEIRRGRILEAYIGEPREDGKLDVLLRPPGRDHIAILANEIFRELTARGGFWPLGDHSPAEEINAELGVSKRAFKQATGALLRDGKILLSDAGMKIAAPAEGI